MARRWPHAAAALVLTIVGAIAAPQSARGEEAGAPATKAQAEPRSVPDHPLAWVLKYARDERAYLQSAVRDFTCRVTKRERIEGELQEHHAIDMRVREQSLAGTQVVQPLSVMLEFLGPERVEGRRVLFVAGQNDGKLLVRKGGRRFGYVVVDVDPDGPIVRQESLMPISEIGFSHLLDRMIRTLEQDMVADPSGDDTIVEHIKGVAIDDRACEMLRVTHPRRRDGLQFFSASVAIDTELHVPVRFDVYDWPESPGGQPPLTAEFTYTNVTLNPNLDDAVFTTATLRAP